MRAINTEYYGDDTRWFVGEVKSIADPDELGRVRVRIFGLHTSNTSKIKNTDLPWANVVLPVTQGGTSQTTSPTGIQIGAKVFGVFIDGSHSQVPLVLGSIPHNPQLRVSYDGPSDNYVIPVPSQSAPQFREGDEINGAINERLSNAGESRGVVGAPLTQQQADILNGVVAGAGDLGTDLIGQNRQEQAFNFLKQYFQRRGHNNPGYIAAAFVGNFMNESFARLDPTIGETDPLVPGSRGGFGIAQWTGPRRVALEKYAANHNAYVGNFTMQLNWVIDELEKTHGYVFTWLQEDQTMESATETVFAWYENPSVSVNFKSAHPEAKSWRSYQRAGGIAAFLRRNSQQGSVIRAYRLEYEERLGDAKAVYNAYGG